METTKQVLDTLKKNGKPMKAGEIAEASGIDKKEVEKAIKTLVKEGKAHSPVRCFYAPK
ncbi:MAG: MarR family transcriptional regulator [Bacteroidetes bacterium HGW-Bacteroidetes-21]|jgi:DNA-binding IclR family transcriptional regulator|nr:MAG: MarR family transcriptional regulator [Bacteroidetes bacterium HGW-Bacteroidetes-21]